MKIIKITTENEITTLEFPEGDITSVNKRLYEMIGPKCELMEHVMPSRLYKILGASNRPKKEKGSCTSILMDEEAWDISDAWFRKTPYREFITFHFTDTDIRRTFLIVKT